MTAAARPDGRSRPSAEQELLLRAALLPGPAAGEAWSAWRAVVDLNDKIDDGSFRLLPLVCRNLERAGVEADDLARLRGVYRQTWLRNQVVVHRVAPVLRAFNAAGIQTMLLKGAPLALLTYGELGARPMGDIDVLVHPRHARRALQLLVDDGWTCRSHPDGRFDRVLHTFHAVGLHTPDAGLDLHWHALEEGNFRDADEPFWEASRGMELDGVPTRTLCPTDMLLHVLAHGARWDPVPPIRWVADAFLVISRHSADIDWDRLVEQATRLRLTLGLHAALSYLHERFDAVIPPAVLDRLAAVPVSRIERWDFRAQAAPPTTAWQVARYGTRYLRLSRGRSPFQRALGAPVFMQEMLGLSSAWQVPRRLIRGRRSRTRGQAASV